MAAYSFIKYKYCENTKLNFKYFIRKICLFFNINNYKRIFKKTIVSITQVILRIHFFKINI